MDTMRRIVYLFDELKPYFEIKNISNLPKREVNAEEFRILFSNDPNDESGHIKLSHEKTRWMFNSIDEIEPLLIRIFIDPEYIIK